MVSTKKKKGKKKSSKKTKQEPALKVEVTREHHFSSIFSSIKSLILKIPGFRTGQRWKKVVALFTYVYVAVFIALVLGESFLESSVVNGINNFIEINNNFVCIFS